MQYLVCLLAVEQQDLTSVFVYCHYLGTDLRPVVEFQLEVETFGVFEGLFAGVGAHLDEVYEEAVVVADLGKLCFDYLIGKRLVLVIVLLSSRPVVGIEKLIVF